LVSSNVAQSGVDDGSNGAALNWLNANHATFCGSAAASAQVPRFEGGLTHNLVVTGYNFATIPDGATVLGITLSINKDTLGPGSAFDARVSLVDPSGAFTTENKARPEAWPAAATVPYGNNEDTWGRSWTGADVKTANFGWVIAANTTRDNSSFSDFYAFVDCAQVAICYAP
jgi:hypothetical protein